MATLAVDPSAGIVSDHGVGPAAAAASGATLDVGTVLAAIR